MLAVSARVGSVRNNHPSLIARSLPRLVTGNPEGATNWHKWVAAFFVTQAIVGCAGG